MRTTGRLHVILAGRDIPRSKIPDSSSHSAIGSGSAGPPAHTWWSRRRAPLLGSTGLHLNLAAGVDRICSRQRRREGVCDGGATNGCGDRSCSGPGATLCDLPLGECRVGARPGEVRLPTGRSPAQALRIPESRRRRTRCSPLRLRLRDVTVASKVRGVRAACRYRRRSIVAKHRFRKKGDPT